MERVYDKFGHYTIKKNPIFKTGILQYAPSEIGVTSEKPLLNVYRDPNQVAEVMDSLIGSPIIIGHAMLCGERSDVGYSCSLSEEVKVIGSVIGNVIIEGGIGYADLSLWQEPQDGALEFSVGMDAEIIEESGVLENGESYDMIQVINIFNHLAFVPRGRAGRDVKILDTGAEVEEKLDEILGLVKSLEDRLSKLEKTEEDETPEVIDEEPKEEVVDESSDEKKEMMDSGEVAKMIQDAVALSKLEDVKKQKAYEIGSKHVGAFNHASMDSGEVIGYVTEKLKIPKTLEAIIAFDSAKAIAIADNATPTQPVMSEDVFMADFVN